MSTMTTATTTKKIINKFDGEYRWLSNFWPCKVVLEGVEFPSVEHAYQAAKTLDVETRKVISQIKTAGGAKKAGRSITLRKDWPEAKLEIMKGLVRQKFGDPTLRKLLASTENAELVEGNYWGDVEWGVYRGQGKNLLGKILMEIRNEIKSDGETSAPAS
jgi:ribA/ribD-fused uncharacterized protein